MFVVLPFFHGDAHLLRHLLKWIHQLDGKVSHGALLACDASVDWSVAAELIDLAKQCFQRVEIIATENTVEGWPYGPNAIFKAVAEHLQKRNTGPWFWCEPDCIPHKKGWIDKLELDYNRSNQPFMGAVMEAKEPSMPSLYMAGCGVYPMDTWKRLSVAWKDDVAFDIATAPVVVPQATNTPLIQHFWGKKNLPPTFAPEKLPDSPVNTFTLANLNPDAVVFHRNKDVTLLRELGYSANSVSHETQFMVVYPFFNGDAAGACKNMEWIADLGNNSRHEVLLWYERGTEKKWITRIEAAAKHAFSGVTCAAYATKIRGPNGAFVEAAKTLQRMRRNWLWMEYDAIPIKPQWVDALQSRYDRCGMEFCGPVIPGPSHMNGTGIYPADTPDIIPNTMRTKDTVGFDVIMKPEMIDLCADCSDIYFHCWGVVNGRLHPSGGDAPSFAPGSPLLNQIPSSAVIMHRCKDGTLIDRLRERMK